jgi:hypothetical protein
LGCWAVMVLYWRLLSFMGGWVFMDVFRVYTHL